MSVQPSAILDKIKNWAKRLRRDVMALYLASRDPRVPWLAKIIAALVAAYAFSPIDLIPDFIPIIGYLDDLLIVPLGITLAIRLIPTKIMQDLRNRTEKNLLAKPTGWRTAAIIVIIWILVATVLGWIFLDRYIRQ